MLIAVARGFANMFSNDELAYFAYGSNMSVLRLAARLPSAKVVTTGFLIGYK